MIWSLRMPAAAEFASEFAAAAGPFAAGAGGGPHTVINPPPECVVYRPPARRTYTRQTSTPRPLRTHITTAAALSTSDRTAVSVNNLCSRRPITVTLPPALSASRRHHLPHDLPSVFLPVSPTR